MENKRVRRNPKELVQERLQELSREYFSRYRTLQNEYTSMGHFLHQLGGGDGTSPGTSGQKDLDFMIGAVGNMTRLCAELAAVKGKMEGLEELNSELKRTK